VIVDPTHTQLIGEALAAADPAAWCARHRAQIDADFLFAAKQQLDEALQSGVGEAFALGDLITAARPMAEIRVSPDLLGRIGSDLDRSNGILSGDFSDWGPVFE